MKNQGLVYLVIAVIAFMALNNGGTTTPNDGNGGNVDLTQLVSPSVSFTGYNKYITGTALPTEYVRILQKDSGNDFGQKSMNSGTLSVEPNVDYKLYWGENSSTYYTSVESYTGHTSDTVQPKSAGLCTIDTAPSITSFDENGQVQTGSANDQAIGASETVSIELKIKSAADKCYGNPDAPKKNAICFDYNSTVFKKVEVQGAAPITAPYSISSAKGAGLAERCFDFDKIADTDYVRLTVNLESQADQPTTAHDITVSLEDIGFDLDADNLAEIWGYEDESNNNLGATSAVTGTIYIA